MVSYQLSASAAEDLDHIFSDGAVRYGLARANDYYDGLIAQFHLLCDNPDIGVSADELLPDLQKFTYRRHVIFFINQTNSILIVRVLGQEMDLPRHL